jgi:hypothetical protein
MATHQDNSPSLLTEVLEAIRELNARVVALEQRSNKPLASDEPNDFRGQPLPSGKQSWTVEEAACAFDMHVQTLRRYCREGRITAERHGRRGGKGDFRITREEVVRYLSTRILHPQGNVYSNRVVNRPSPGTRRKKQ